MREKNALERERISGAILALGYNVVPSHTNFILVHFGAQAATANKHLAENGLIVREVANYGLPEFLRISIGTEEENDLLVDALTRFAQSQAA